MTKEQAYIKIAALAERFAEQLVSYKKAEYNETLTRRDFIDPFFKALGWDMDNSNGYAESYREVIHEAKIKIGGATKAPDYSFRPGGGKVLFFVEAKKPNIAVKDEILPAYQIRRYGWSAGLAISIITDFEEFAIYDCTKKPFVTDKASTARIRYLTFKDYLKEFDFLWNTFSKEAVLKGGLDRFAANDTNKKGTAPVDKDFLLSLDQWRALLATDICKKNKNLTEDEINFAVQQTIDRFIFLRIAEGRGAEAEGQIQDCIKHGEYYSNLFQLFQTADDKYNSGLFDFKKDQISKHLLIDNKVIKTIITDLYFPKSPYEFAVLPVEILGSAYEQFLGKQIIIDKAHRARIEEKPEVRKAGGVYYTPQYIVDYIVQNTIGKLVEDKTPKEVSKIKIVDPACGSGSFLLGAYAYLLNWHKDYYTNHGKLSGNSAIIRRGIKGDVLTPEGNLTTSEKKRILLNNIYGVDIDVNAVEVTKLSLLLKCMEGETFASIDNQLRLFNERILPTLENNIKSGNSLVDTDYYDSQIDFGEEKKIKPFSWKKAFPEVFNRKAEKTEREDLTAIAQKARHHAQKTLEYVNELEDKINQASEPTAEYGNVGGFDVVIGNPPYGASFSDSEKDYLLKKFVNQNYQLDSYQIFLEQAFKSLLKINGKFGMIIPNPWLTNLLQKKLRKFIFQNVSVNEIVHFKKPVFPKVTVDTEIVLFTNENPVNAIVNVVVIEKGKSLLFDKHAVIIHKQKEWIAANGDVVNIFQSESDKSICKKIVSESKSLEVYLSINVGIKPYQTGKGKPKQTKSDVENRVFDSDKKINSLYREYLRGSDMNRYSTNPVKIKFLKYGEWLAEPRPAANFDSPVKIFMRQTSDSLIATLDEKQFLCLNNLHVLVPKDNFNIDIKYFLGLINSRMMNWYYQTLNPEKGEALAEVKKSNVAQLPVRIGAASTQKEIVKLVNQLLQLNAEKSAAKLQTKISQLESKIDYCESRINQLVYQLYDLTEDEIKIIEDH